MSGTHCSNLAALESDPPAPEDLENDAMHQTSLKFKTFLPRRASQQCDAVEVLLWAG
jgi:hypothetical protein